MLRNNYWFNMQSALDTELQQSRDEGKDADGFLERVKIVNQISLDSPKRDEQVYQLLDEIGRLPVSKENGYEEPSDLIEINQKKPKSGSRLFLQDGELPEKILYDKVYGAWLGRSAGCLLGQPVECWTRSRINGLLKETGNYPIKSYISSDIPEEIIKKYEMDTEANWINKVTCFPSDDDLNYTVIALKLIEKYGKGFTPDDVAECWMESLPCLATCTAELVAYRNIVNKIYPPMSARFRNPYREWIGAQIRGDFFGYLNPGNLELAAEMAWRDASISHTKNGIYGEMFIAAMLAAAVVISDVEKIIQAGLSQIPEKCRLADAIRDVLTWKPSGLDWEAAIEKLHSIYDENNSHHAVHTISNAMIVCLGLIYGEGNFEKSIAISIHPGFDTDCNGATVGSIMGMIIGAENFPPKWSSPLNDQLKSGVMGYNQIAISELAEKTLKLIKATKK